MKFYMMGKKCTLFIAITSLNLLSIKSDNFWRIFTVGHLQLDMYS